MDTLIINGDFFRDDNGRLSSVSGEKELLQRALICLSTEKGSFSYDRELGSELHTLCNYERSKLDDLAYEFAVEALLGIEDISVKKAKVSVADNIYNIEITLLLQGKKRSVKIEI